MDPNLEAIERQPNPLFKKLQRVIAPLQAIVGDPLTIDPKDPLNIHGGVNAAGRFSFWGGIESLGFHADLPDKPTAIIKNLRIPEDLRKQGLGSKIVKTWEDELSKEGINVFAATNIKDHGVIDFWKKQGYQIPKSESHKDIPYFMYKLIQNEANLPA